MAKASDASLEAIQEKEDTTLYLSEYKVSEAMVKLEDNECRKVEDDIIGIAPHHAIHGRADDLKTLEKGIIYFFYRSRVNVGSTGTCGIHDVSTHP